MAQIDAGSARIARAVNALQQHITFMRDELDPRSPHAAKTDADLDMAAEVDIPLFAHDSHAAYRLLIPSDVEPILRSVHDLFVIPSGPLFDLSWETLVTDDANPDAPHYLIEQMRIAYDPSASILRTVRDERRGRRRAPDPLLAFADPDYGARSAEFPQLRSARREAERVRAILDAPASSIVAGDDATVSRVLDLNEEGRLKDFRYLLFATHAILADSVHGLTEPAIVLAHPERDGFLTMSTIFKLTLDADFVELSACDTGTGGETATEGASGLTRAFMYAGTSTIAVTLWEMNDDTALRLSPGIFAGLRNGMSLAEALQAAKIGMIGDRSAPRFQHPFFWAPMVLFGDADEIRRAHA